MRAQGTLLGVGLFIICGGSVFGQANMYCVDNDSGYDTNADTSWTDALLTLQWGIARTNEQHVPTGDYRFVRAASPSCSIAAFSLAAEQDSSLCSIFNGGIEGQWTVAASAGFAGS